MFGLTTYLMGTAAVRLLQFLCYSVHQLCSVFLSDSSIPDPAPKRISLLQSPAIVMCKYLMYVFCAPVGKWRITLPPNEFITCKHYKTLQFEARTGGVGSIGEQRFVKHINCKSFAHCRKWIVIALQMVGSIHNTWLFTSVR